MNAPASAPSAGTARVHARSRFYLFGTNVMSCAGCYGPPHMIETRAYLYKYQLAGGLTSPAVCCQSCIAPALRRAAYKPAPLSPLAETLRRQANTDFAEQRRIQSETARETRMAKLRALGEDAVAKAMTDVIIARVTGQEACEFRHLKQAGFTADEITRLSAAAVASAAARHPDLRG